MATFTDGKFRTPWDHEPRATIYYDEAKELYGGVQPATTMILGADLGGFFDAVRRYDRALYAWARSCWYARVIPRRGKRPPRFDIPSGGPRCADLVDMVLDQTASEGGRVRRRAFERGCRDPRYFDALSAAVVLAAEPAEGHRTWVRVDGLGLVDVDAVASFVLGG